jgi:hypothetical protein
MIASLLSAKYVPIHFFVKIETLYTVHYVEQVHTVNRVCRLAWMPKHYFLCQNHKTTTATGLCTVCTVRTLEGFNFILFWKFNRNQTENDRYRQKITFDFLQNI